MKRHWTDPEFRALSAAASSKCMKRRWADPKFRARSSAAASKRMKQLWADPKFRALSVAAASKHMKKLWADPVHVAKHSAISRERMIRLNSDPAFVAARRLRRPANAVPDDIRAAVVVALRADPHARRVAAKFPGMCYETILKIAKTAGIRLSNIGKLTPQQKRDAIRRRARGERVSDIARRYNVNERTIARQLRRTMSTATRAAPDDWSKAGQGPG